MRIKDSNACAATTGIPKSFKCFSASAAAKVSYLKKPPDITASSREAKHCKNMNTIVKQ
jgi:hypothetical protein